MSLSEKIAKDHAFGVTISYVGEWHEELLGFVRNQVGRITLRDLQGQYHVDMN